MSPGVEPNALLVEGGGYLTAVYNIPDMKLLGRKALSLPVTRVVSTPDCLGSQRGKVSVVSGIPNMMTNLMTARISFLITLSLDRTRSWVSFLLRVKQSKAVLGWAAFVSW